MIWHVEVDRELEEILALRRRLRNVETELSDLYTINADNVRKAHRVFRTLYHIEQVVMKCPMCGVERDEDGILAHKLVCKFADTLENANDF